MKEKMKYTVLLALLPLAVACSSDDESASDVVQNGQVVENVVETDSVLGLTSQQQSMVAPLNNFAVNLFREQSQRTGEHSTVVSPLGVAMVLGMLNEGAEGQTSEEISKAIGFSSADKDALSQLFSQLLSAVPKADPGISAALANTVLVNSSECQLQTTYQEKLQQFYDAFVLAMDFQSPLALKQVNSWCDQNTKGLIPAIIDNLDPNVLACLLNATYFKGKWTEPFDASKSFGEGFFLKKEVTILKTMHKQSSMLYGEQKNVKALRLPLGNGTYAMTIVVPTSLDSYVSGLSAKALQEMTFTQETVKAFIPVFTTSTTLDLIGLLKNLGISKVFDKNMSELAGIVQQQKSYPIYVDLMKQSTQMGINEEGCEGAAVTIAELMMGEGRGDSVVKEFRANRPFLYYLSELQSGAILFMGQFCGD